MLWRRPGAPPRPDLEEVAQPLPSAVNKQWMRGLSADATVLDLLDSGCLSRTPTALSLGRQTPRGSRPKVPALPD